MRMRPLGCAALLVAFCVLAGTAAFAQLQSGRILGTVFDPNAPAYRARR